MKFLPAAVILALSAAIVPSYAFVTPSFLSSPTTTAVPVKPFSALSMVATGDLTVHGEAKPRKTRQVRNDLLCLTCSCTLLRRVDARFIDGMSGGFLGLICRNSQTTELEFKRCECLGRS